MCNRHKESRHSLWQREGRGCEGCLWMLHVGRGAVYKYFVLFSHQICHQKFSDRKAGSLEEEIENCA